MSDIWGAYFWDGLLLLLLLLLIFWVFFLGGGLIIGVLWYIFINKTHYFSGKQLSRAATKNTRQIARVRIHVERAIERLKDFKIFQGNLPLTLAALADQMLIVCGALCNLLKPLAR